MAISPDFGLEQAQAIADSYAQAELEILGRIKKYLEQGIDVPDWDRQRLANVQNLRAWATTTLSDFNNNLAMDLEDSIAQAYDAGGASAYSDLYNEVEEISAIGSLARQEAVSAIARELTGAVVTASNAVLRQVEDAYRNIVAESISLVTAGGMTRRTATQQAITKFLNNGLTVAPTGRGQMNIADYTQMAIRTGTARASVEGHLDAMGVNGINLVYINPGPRHCELCHTWTGKVLYARSGKAGDVTVTNMKTGGKITVHVAGSLDTARSAGWGHPNCRCSVSAYIPGASRVPAREKFDLAGYTDQQQQRVNERKIREWKRREELAITPEEQAKSASKVKEWQQKQRDLMRSNPDLKRQPSREQLFPRGGASSTTGATKPPTTPTPKNTGVHVDPPTGKPFKDIMDIEDEIDITQAFVDVYEGHEYNGFTTKVRYSVQKHGDNTVKMTIVAPNGQSVGRVERTFTNTNDGLIVHHDLMEIDPDFRGRGFSTAFSKYSEEAYRAGGVNRITIEAGLDDGGYVWAKAGYLFDDVPYNVVSSISDLSDDIITSRITTDIPMAERRIISDKMRALKDKMETLDPTDPNYPTPFEIANLNASGTIDGKSIGEYLLRGNNWDGYKEL